MRVRRHLQQTRLLLAIAAACVTPAVLFVVQGYVSAKLNGRTTRWQDAIFSAGDWLALGPLTFIPYRMAGWFPLRRSRWAKSLAMHGLGTLAFSLAWATLGMVLGLALHRFPGEKPYAVSYANWILITIPFGALIYFGMLGCVYAYGYFVEVQQREADAARLAAQLAEVRLGALRMQLNPHFLFNSLNAVLVLVRDREMAAAARMLELISDVLRQVLQTDRPQQVPLADELRFVERYLAIEQVRFSDRLGVQWSIEDQARMALVPDLVMQPLVENAIRHGVAKRAEGGTLSISARIAGDSLEISIRDDGAGIEPAEDQREGVGLTNTRERLRALYGDAAGVAIAPSRDGGTEVTLRLPYRIVDHG